MNALLEFLIYIAIFFAGLLALYLSCKFIRWLWRYLHAVVDDTPLTFDEELRRNMLPTGFYMICGRQRAGKGALGCAIMDIDCTYHCQERLDRAQAVIDRLNALDQDEPYDLHLPDFPYKSKNKMHIGPEWKETYHCDIPQFALPDGDNDDTVQYHAPFTVFHAEEYDAYMNARTWKDDPKKKANIIDGYKWLGHNDLVAIGDAQVFNRLDAAARALVTDIFYIIKRKDYYQGDEPRKWWQFSRKYDNEVIRTEWTFLWIKNQMQQQADAINKYGTEFIPKSDYIKKCVFKYDGNIYAHYNSKSGQAYWFKGIKDYTVEYHSDDNLTRAAVDDYCARNARRAENATSETEK